MARGIAVVVGAVIVLAACTIGRDDAVVDRGPGVAPAGPGVVTVVRGDTVHSIARRHGVDPAQIIAANRLRAPYLLVPGQRLRLPLLGVHVVRSGDTLLGVARRYGVDPERLARANGLAPPYRLFAGATLVLPQIDPRGGAVVVPSERDRPFTWPVRGEVIASFGPQGGGVYHDGIEIAPPPGAAVVAADSGIVAYAGNSLRNLGNVLLIRHADGWFTAYALAGSILVQRGEPVLRGQPVATMAPARDTLHFQVRRGTEAVDPMRHLANLVVGALPVNAPPPG